MEVSLTGGDPGALKAVTLELASVLTTVPGVGGIEDDMPFGQEQLIVRLTPQASALGLTQSEVAGQLHATYESSATWPGARGCLRAHLFGARLIHSLDGFSSRQQVRISRRSVKAVIVVTSVLVRRDFALKVLFKWLTRNPKPSIARA